MHGEQFPRSKRSGLVTLVTIIWLPLLVYSNFTAEYQFGFGNNKSEWLDSFCNLKEPLSRTGWVAKHLQCCNTTSFVPHRRPSYMHSKLSRRNATLVYIQGVGRGRQCHSPLPFCLHSQTPGSYLNFYWPHTSRYTDFFFKALTEVNININVRFLFKKGSAAGDAKERKQ